MNILVTGGLGVVGSWVSRRLVHEGHRPIIFARHLTTSLIPDIIDKVDIVMGDISDIPSIIRVLKEYRIKTVVHLAALMGRAAQFNPLVGFSINAGGTVNVLEAARIMEVERVVFTSSKLALSPIIGDHSYPTYKPVDETYGAYPAAPTTVYGIAKVASELMGNTYSEQYGFEFVALRFAQVFGPGKSGGQTVLAQIIENAMSGYPTVIPQGSDEKDDMTYIKDVANAVVLACFAKNVQHRLFHIGTGKGYSYADFAQSIRKVYPSAVIDIGPGLRRPPGLGFVMDISRARQELGYIPTFSPDEAVKDYVEVMKQFDFKPLSGPVQTTSVQSIQR
jgi:UDP-glucose 4-epimerase